MRGSTRIIRPDSHRSGDSALSDGSASATPPRPGQVGEAVDEVLALVRRLLEPEGRIRTAARARIETAID